MYACMLKHVYNTGFSIIRGFQASMEREERAERERERDCGTKAISHRYGGGGGGGNAVHNRLGTKAIYLLKLCTGHTTLKYT